MLGPSRADAIAARSPVCQRGTPKSRQCTRRLGHVLIGNVAGFANPPWRPTAERCPQERCGTAAAPPPSREESYLPVHTTSPSDIAIDRIKAASLVTGPAIDLLKHAIVDKLRTPAAV